MRTVIVIPARYASSRLPGKPLADLLGKPMVQHVVERARRVGGVERVLVATDDRRILDAVVAFGGEAVLTREDHPSGTDRLAEVAASVEGDLFVNLQGDEPLIRPADIELLISGMRDNPAVDVGTLCHALPASEAADPNLVKVVLGASGDALYFSRAPIPFPREPAEGAASYLKHIGIYAYRRPVLAHYGTLPVPMIEQSEKLEQLRLLHAGYRIRVFQVAPTGPGVDTPEGLEEVRRRLAAGE